MLSFEWSLLFYINKLIMQYFLNPWPWYVSGPLISLVMALLLYLGKSFGMSSNLDTLCSMTGVGKYINFFDFNWKERIWNLLVVLGALIGGGIVHNFLSNGSFIHLNATTIDELQAFGFQNIGASLVPEELFGLEAILTVRGFFILVVGGLLIGFGTRYAGGCTSGHAITGLSSMQLPSLIAVCGFFIG